MFTKALALLTLLGNIFTAVFFLSFILAKPSFRLLQRFLGDHVLAIGFFLSAASTMGSLVYSEVVGFPACILCWIQRIFMYPMLFLFGFAWWRKDRSIIPYTLLLSLLGAAVALYQWMKDMLALYGNIVIPCPAVTALPSCDKIYVLEYGYITIPMIALNAFLLIAITMYAGLRSSHD